MAKRAQKAPPRSVSIDTMSDSLTRTLRQERRSEATVDSYTLSVRLLREYLERHGRDTTIDVSRDDIRDFLIEQATPRTMTDNMGRKHKTGSAATALVRFKSLRAFFNHCVREDELELSPMAGMSAPKVEPDPVPVVNDDTLKLLLAVRSGKTLEHRRDTALLRVFLDTGCRLSEVTNLRWADIDLNDQALCVRGKGNRMRFVPFGLKASTALDRYRRLLEREGDDVGPDVRVWLGRQGVMSNSGVTNALHRMCADAGVPQLHWHQLRHTAAHEARKEGLGDAEMMRIFGWRSQAMVLRYGASAADERAREAYKKLSLGDRV
jgi:site-specific recombinase XerD